MGLGTPRARASSPGITGQSTAPGTTLPLIPRISYQVSLAEPGTGPESQHPGLVLRHMSDYEQLTFYQTRSKTPRGEDW